MSEKIELTQEELEKRINEELEKKLQAETDKRVTQALKTAEEKHKEQIELAKAEAVKKAQMTAEELARAKEEELAKQKELELKEIGSKLKEIETEKQIQAFKNKLLEADVDKGLIDNLVSSVSLDKMEDFDPTPFKSVKQAGGSPTPKEPKKEEIKSTVDYLAKFF